MIKKLKQTLTIKNYFSADWDCHIVEQGGFLKISCFDKNDNETIMNTCHNSEEMYRPDTIGEHLIGNLCSNDRYFYQACQANHYTGITTRTNNGTLCGRYLCLWKGIEHPTSTIKMNLHLPGIECNGQLDCHNTDLDERKCSEKDMERTILPTGKSVPTHQICDGICSDDDCEDEATCNGYTYGIYCDIDPVSNTMTYVPPYQICNLWDDCNDGADEKNCTVIDKSQPSCEKFDPWTMETVVKPLHNFTRCYTEGVQLQGNLDNDHKYLKWKGYCDPPNLYDMTNCSDPDRVGMTCRVNGYITTVSRSMICYTKSKDRIKICDEHVTDDFVDIVNECYEPSKGCFVHKHFMCDEIQDCNYEIDEIGPICGKMTKEKCKRRVGNSQELPVPLDWIDDGIEDCVDGRDEKRVWPSCGTGISFRFVVISNDSCENVYVCPWDKPMHVELDNLCDGLETCGNENEVCSVSYISCKTYSTLLTSNKGLSKHLSFCIKGLKDTQNFMMNCTTFDSFIFPDHDYFGVENRTSITLPRDLQNCDHMFGEVYVYTSCINKCINSSCPLRNIPRYEVCPGQFPDRIGTIVNNEYLAFFTKSFRNIYTNRYFVCDNKIKCIDYSQVCDLVNDCGDGSDEEFCTNHFKCASSGRYIPKTSICDKQFDCMDLSDECNSQCSKSILKNVELKLLSWIIGFLAVMTNLIIISKNILTIKKSRTTVALLNKSLIMMISFGDLLVGSYLFVISIYDGIIFQDSYCSNQISWITSSSCSVIGVLSTLGSQVSLFAMCVLSVTRIIGICNSMKIPGEVTWIKSIQVTSGMVTMILLSFSIAAVPIIQRFEDFFVNGVKYADELRIFMGTPNKKIIQAVLRAYHSRMKETTLSWNRINKMVKEMYSHDFDYPDHTNRISKLDFYGNDGVCLFKYFVKDQDPQRLFAWSILTVNFVCFILITVSYVVIGFISHKSSKSLTQSGGNQQVSQRNRKMNRKISIIILTDFLCWIPFIVICVLHSIELLDATPWYSLFSIIILPINSVINPLIYDDTISNLISRPVEKISTSVSSSRVFQSFKLSLSSAGNSRVDSIELDSNIRNQS